jgi:F-type H+-transporting ATPase subunit a
MHAFLQIATPGGAGSDTLHVMGHRVVESPAGGTGEENLFIELLHHLRDANTIEVPIVGHLQLPQFPPLHVGGVLIDVSITKHVVFLWIAAAVLCVLLSYAARRNSKSSVPRGLGNLMEVFVEFVRDQIVVPTMGPGGLRYLPYLLTTFFFILMMNLLGLFPYGATATGNVSVTAGLAAIAFIMIQVAAIRSQGIGHYLAHLTGGVHWALWPIMIPIEIIGLFTKPFALCIRLFANMTAGHVVIASLFGLIFLYKSYVLAPGPVAFAVAINMLELFIAFLQAYIFVMLTALFMGLGMQTGHAPAHDEQHAREHHGH